MNDVDIKKLQTIIENSHNSLVSSQCIHKHAVGDQVFWTNSYGVELGVRTIIGLDWRNGPTYYLDPHDAWWFSVSEEYLQKI